MSSITSEESSSLKKRPKNDELVSSIASENKPGSSSLAHYNNQIYPPKNESKLMSVATSSASSICPIHKFKKKKKKKKSKYKLNENVERQLGRAKRLRLLFGNDSISIDIKNKLRLS